MRNRILGDLNNTKYKKGIMRERKIGEKIHTKNIPEKNKHNSVMTKHARCKKINTEN